MRIFDDSDSEATVELLTCKQSKQYLLGIVQNSNQLHDPAQLRETMLGF